MMKSTIKMMSAMLIASLFSSNAIAQPNYDDVLVVINTNSAISDSVGMYFVQARNIPLTNIAYVTTSTQEEIDSIVFNDLRTQIEDHLTTNNLVNSINYIVTTKGVPLKVNRGNTFSTSSPSSSVESELTLILGPYSGSIGGNGIVISPYYYQNATFSRAAYGIYLVTRLDGYTFADIKNMIDRSGPNTPVSPASVFVLDQDPSWNNSLPGLNNYLAAARTRLVNKNLNAYLNQDTVFVIEHEEVIGYASWGSNDRYQHHFTEYARPQHEWTAGSIAETYVSTSGRTFNAPATYGQSLIADLIAEGITGAKGYVYEPFSSSMALVFILFDRYTSGFNLAESFYMASRSLSWMDVIIGDPKTTIMFTDGNLPIQLGSFTAEVVNHIVELAWTTISEVNNYGFQIERRTENEEFFQVIPGSFVPGNGTTLEPQSYSYVDSTPPAGTVYYRLRQIDLDGTIHYHGPVQVTVNVLASSGNETHNPLEFRLSQNFPNPFNPSTQIEFTVPATGHVTLKVYNMIGQEIATLIDGETSMGNHTATFTASHLATGTYFYQLRMDNRVETRRMMVVK